MEEKDLKEAFAAVRHAQDTRRYHGKRTVKGGKQREEDLSAARERVKRAMVPIRSYLGLRSREPSSKDETIERVREASAALQSERRKLWKMQSRR